MTEIPDDAIPVLDHGYVRFEDSMGNDLKVVNAAKASFAKKSLEFGKNEKGLMNYLKREKEYSPFRHALITFEVRAPLMIARQWWKYVVGSDHTMDAWNEASRRYVTEEPQYHVPEWRAAPASRKQGSMTFVSPSGELETMLNFQTRRLEERQLQSAQDYNDAIEAGIAPEQARVFLLAYGLYVQWWWTGSLQSILHFLDERLAENAQSAMHEYAIVVRRIAQEYFPVSIGSHDCTKGDTTPNLDRIDHPANTNDWTQSYSRQGYQVYRCRYCGDYWGCRHQYDAGTGQDDRWLGFGPNLEDVRRHY